MYYNQIGRVPVHTIAIMMNRFENIFQIYESWARPIAYQYNKSWDAAERACSWSDAADFVTPRVKSVPTKLVFLEVAEGFVVYFDNLANGGGATTVAPALAAKVGCTTIRVTDDNSEGQVSLLISIFDSSMASKRWFSWMDDGNGMEFMSGGEALPQESDIFEGAPSRLTSTDLARLVESVGASLDVDPDKIMRCQCITEDRR